jgi:hypothetical protein
MPLHRILYVGSDVTLPRLFNGELKPLDCFMVRCPDDLHARVLLEHGIKYSLLLFDEAPTGETNGEIKRFADSLTQQRHVPVVMPHKQVELAALVKAIRHVLNI